MRKVFETLGLFAKLGERIVSEALKHEGSNFSADRWRARTQQKKNFLAGKFEREPSLFPGLGEVSGRLPKMFNWPRKSVGWLVGWYSKLLNSNPFIFLGEKLPAKKAPFLENLLIKSSRKNVSKVRLRRQGFLFELTFK